MKRNAILGVFCPKRNVTFFSVSLSKLGTDRNFIKNSVTLLLSRSGAQQSGHRSGACGGTDGAIGDGISGGGAAN